VRDRVVYNFVADGYRLASEESLCQQEIRGRLQSQGRSGKNLAFLAPERSRVTSNRYRITGEVVIVSENASAEYSCEVDSRTNQILDASASVVASR
jgi:hypothetical protein